MVSGTLYTYPENFRAYKALIAAKYSNADVKVDPNFVFGETNKSEAFLKKFPSGKVPAFESADGKYLQDGNAIAHFVSNDQLRGKSDLEKAQILQWICFGESDILPAVCAWVFPVLGIIQHDKKTLERGKTDVAVVLNVLNAHLTTRTYLVGERVTLADISVACNLLNLYINVLDPTFRTSYVNVNRWFNTIINQPNVRAVIGEVNLCDKVAEVDPKKYQQNQQQQAQQGAQQGGQQGGQQQAKAASKPANNAVAEKTSKKKSKKKEKKEEDKQSAKKEKAVAEKPVVEELDATEQILAEEPKQRDPFDALPKGTFNMDDYKRFYSNNDEDKAVAYFWEKFDPENYSIWFGEYKYNDELTKVFMSCNLISGMYQRLDKMRKQAFASVCLWGADNDSSISGVWVWRGQDLAFPLSPDWQIDYETYSWEKLDPKSDKTKQLVEQYFSWIGTDSKGRKFNQGKIFK